jgi:hypothetical protein
MRIGLFFLFLIASSSAFTQPVKYRVSVMGKAAGTGTITEKETSHGTIVTTISLSLTLDGEKVAMDAVEEYRADGTPVRSSLTATMTGRSEKSVVAYGKQSATVTRIIDGKSTKKDVPLPKGSIRVPSIQWFAKTLPKVGTKVAFWSLDDSTYRWDQDYEKYSKKTKIASRGKMVTAHLIESRDVKMWVDDKGDTIRMVLSEGGIEIVLERS